MQKYKKTLLLIIGVALVVAVYGFYTQRQTQIPPTETSNDSEWLTYTDERYGVSFDYPKDGHVRITQDSSEYNVYIRKLRGGEGVYSIWLTTVPKNATSPSNCIDKNSEGYDYVTLEKNGVTAFFAKGVNPDQNTINWSIVCIDMHKDYFVSVISWDENRDDDVAYKVIDTIQF